METKLSTRNLCIGERVYVVPEDFHGSYAQATIISIDGKVKGEVHFAGDELNVSVNVVLLDDLRDIGKKGEIVNFNNQEIYKIVPNITDESGNEMCYEHFSDIDYMYYCPARNENFS